MMKNNNLSIKMNLKEKEYYGGQIILLAILFSLLNLNKQKIYNKELKK